MPDHPSRIAAFIAELRHRRVFRVAIVYAGVAFIIFQIVDATFEPLHIPDWVSGLVIILLLLGFLVAVGMAWAFDLTAEGLVRAKVKREPTAAKAPHHIVIGNKTLAVIAMLAVIAAALSWLREPSPGGAISSIAVLPLENLMGDPEQDYFVDGMHEAIITNLARLSALKVISRTSAMRYKDTDKLVPEIARELNVDAVVEGSILKAGNRVRIAAQLIHGASDEHLWSNDYEGDLTDILSLQKTIARAIASEIGLALKPEEEAYLASAPQVNPEAYNLYLKGWHLRSIERIENVPKAVEYLEQAVALDPDFARAWAALAQVYLFTINFVSRDSALNWMKLAIDKALELDPNLPDAHAVLGVYRWYSVPRDIAGAGASFRRAVELDPDNTYVLYEYGLFLRRTGRPDEALEQFRRGQELDPLDPQLLQGISSVYSSTRQYEKGLEYRQAILEIAPGHRLGRSNLNVGEKCEILMQQGRYAEAAAEAAKAGDLFRQLRAEMALGNREKVYAVRDSLRSAGELQQRDLFRFAGLYAIMGERDKALGLLEGIYEENDPAWWFLNGLVYGPELDSLRAEPRFKALMKKIGLTEVFDQYGQRIR